MTQGEDQPGRIVRRGLTWFFVGMGVLAALGLILIAAVLLPVFFDMRGRDAPAPVAANQDKPDAPPYSVLLTDSVDGTRFLAIDIGYPSRGGYSSIATDRRNVILLDKSNGGNRRLLADNRRRVLDRSFFAAEADEAPQATNDVATDEAVVTEVVAAPPPATKIARKPPPLAYYVLRVRKSEGDREDLLVGSFATAQQAFVLTDLDGVDRLWMLAPTRLAVLFRKGRKLHYAVIDVPTLKVVLARPVEIG